MTHTIKTPSICNRSLRLPASHVKVLLQRLLLACLIGGLFPTAGFAEEWLGMLQSPGGTLPFGIEISEDHQSAFAINGEERIPFSDVKIIDGKIELLWEWYDSRIVATLDTGDIATAKSMKGTWTKAATLGKTSSLPFRAVRGKHQRSPASAASNTTAANIANANITGDWIVTFRDDGGEEEAIGQFEQAGRNVTGTFLTRTGDYRFLVGSFDDGKLRLSTFDGAHAFLFHADYSSSEQAPDKLIGDFWSRDSYHATWTARRMKESETVASVLPDEWTMVQPTSDAREFRFSFPDTNGDIVDSTDSRFKDKVVLVNIFGSWCPNCNDEAPLLAKWHAAYAERGLEVVGIGFELSGDSKRDTEMLQRFATRHGANYPILLGGVSDKKKAAAALPDISEVIAYPQTIFIGRDGKIAHIHTGFSGPGTGNRFTKTVEELETRIEELLR